MVKEDGGSKMKHFEFKGSLGEFLSKIDEYFGLKDLSKNMRDMPNTENRTATGIGVRLSRGGLCIGRGKLIETR